MFIWNTWIISGVSELHLACFTCKMTWELIPKSHGMNGKTMPIMLFLHVWRREGIASKSSFKPKRISGICTCRLERCFEPLCSPIATLDPTQCKFKCLRNWWKEVIARSWPLSCLVGSFLFTESYLRYLHPLFNLEVYMNAERKIRFAQWLYILHLKNVITFV